MSKDKHITKVIFRKFPDGDVIALFPELCVNGNMFTCLSYMHIGQHGISPAKLEGTKSCRVGEYFSLFKELESIGYNLKVVARISHEMDQKRIAALREQTAGIYQTEKGLIRYA